MAFQTDILSVSQGFASIEGVVRAGVAAGPERAFEGALAAARRSFADEVKAEGAEKARTAEEIAQEQAVRGRARKSAEDLVATAFILPVLAQLRESSQAEGPFAPGPWEKQFGPMMDVKVAERIVKAQGLPTVAALERRFLEQAGYGGRIDVAGA